MLMGPKNLWKFELLGLWINKCWLHLFKRTSSTVLFTLQAWESVQQNQCSEFSSARLCIGSFINQVRNHSNLRQDFQRIDVTLKIIRGKSNENANMTFSETFSRPADIIKIQKNRQSTICYQTLHQRLANCNPEIPIVSNRKGLDWRAFENLKNPVKEQASVIFLDSVSGLWLVMKERGQISDLLFNSWFE